MPEPPGEDLVWTLTKVGGVIMGLLASAGTILSYWSRRTDTKRQVRQDLEQRIMDLERKYDTLVESSYRQIEGLRTQADQRKSYFDQRLETMLEERERLYTELRKLQIEHVACEHERERLSNELRLHQTALARGDQERDRLTTRVLELEQTMAKLHIGD